MGPAAHRYFHYPFDNQTIVMKLQVAGASLMNCNGGYQVLAEMGLTEENKNELLLPSTKEWTLQGTLSESVSFRHEVVNGVPDLSTCTMRINVTRNSQVFLFKAILTTILVVIGSLFTALYMHPEDYVGDRCAVLFISFLILVTNMQMDLGLGRLSNLIWLDWFNIVQLIMVILAVMETMVVHRLLKRQLDRLAMTLDTTLTFVFPWVFYPLVTISTFLWGIDAERVGLKTVAILLLSIGLPSCLIWTVRMTVTIPSRTFMRRLSCGQWLVLCLVRAVGIALLWDPIRSDPVSGFSSRFVAIPICCHPDLFPIPLVAGRACGPQVEAAAQSPDGRCGGDVRMRSIKPRVVSPMFSYVQRIRQ